MERDAGPDLANRQLLLAVTGWRENLYVTGTAIEQVKADVGAWCAAAVDAVSKRIASATGQPVEHIASMVQPLLKPFEGVASGRTEITQADTLIGGVQPVMRVLGERKVDTPTGVKVIKDIVMDIPVDASHVV